MFMLKFYKNNYGDEFEFRYNIMHIHDLIGLSFISGCISVG